MDRPCRKASQKADRSHRHTGYLRGVAQHLDVGIAARQAVKELAVAPGDEGGLDAPQIVEGLVKPVVLGHQAQYVWKRIL